MLRYKLRYQIGCVTCQHRKIIENSTGKYDHLKTTALHLKELKRPKSNTCEIAKCVEVCRVQYI